MIRTKLVPKRVKIRRWPSKEPYLQFKIKTLLPEQKVVQIKKNGRHKNEKSKKKNKKVYRSVGQNFLKMAEKNPIINYFACRQHAERIIKNIEDFVSKSCHYCRICIKCRKLQTYRNEFKKSSFWTLIKEVKYWDVYDPDWNNRNEVFKLRPIRGKRSWLNL